MRKVFLTSTVIDIPGERAIALQTLRMIQAAGGPKLLYFEHFVGTQGGKEAEKAMNCCFEPAEDEATEAILILGYRSGSPCDPKWMSERFQPYVHAIQKVLGKRNRTRPGVWPLLPRNRKYPPITWVETYIVFKKAGKSEYANPPVVLALVDEELQRMAQAYRKHVSRGTDANGLKKFFEDGTYEQFRKANGEGAGGGGHSEDWVWRMVWLCEFANWLRYDENIHIKSLGRVDRYDKTAKCIEARYKAYSETLASGTLWIQGDVELNRKLANLEKEYEGEVWVWNNDLLYLANRNSFRTIYKPHVRAVRKIKVIVRQKLWDELKDVHMQRMCKNLKELSDENSRDKILVKRIPDKQVKEDMTITLCGVESYLTEEPMMIMRPITLTGGGQSPPRFLNLVLPSNSANIALIGYYYEYLRSRFQSDEGFSKLYELVEDYGAGSQ